MNPRNQKSEENIKKTNRLIEHIEFILNIIIIIFIALSLSDYLLGFIAQDVIDVNHTIGYTCTGIRVLLLAYARVSKYARNKFRKLPKMAKIKYEDLHKIDVEGMQIKSADGKMLEYKYAKSTNDYFAVSLQEFDMGSIKSQLHSHADYMNFDKGKKNATVMLYMHSSITAAICMLPLKNFDHFSHQERKLTNKDISSTQGSAIFLKGMSIDSAHINPFVIGSLMALFCDHAASMISTKQRNYTDVIIYARVTKEKREFLKILKAMEFTLQGTSDGEMTYALKFGEQPENQYVRRIFEIIHNKYSVK